MLCSVCGSSTPWYLYKNEPNCIEPALKEFCIKFDQKELVIVVNPVQIVSEDIDSWEKAMRICIAALMECDVMFCLPEANSRGCLIEQSLCESLGIPVHKFTY